MTDLASERHMIQVEESRFNFAISESMTQKLGKSINFINEFQVMKFEFGIAKIDANTGSPSYAGIVTPKTDFGTKEIFPFDAEILGVEILHTATGSSGTSEIDIKKASSNSGSFTSIFSTTPKVVSAAPANAQFDTFGNASTPTGCTVPVLSTTSVNAGDVLRCDIVSVMAGTPNGFTLNVFFRPR